MKRISSLAVLPLVVAVGACSSGSGSNAQPSNTTDGGSADGATPNADGGASGDDATPGEDGGVSATEYDAVLQGAQVVPTAVLTTASGTGKFMLQPDGLTVNYTITQSVPNATAVNVHIGPAGKVGSVTTHMLTPVSANMTGSFTLTSDEQAALPLDQLYVDVQSQANQGGELRGQLTPPGAEIFVANATGAQEVPPVMSAYSGLGAFVVTWDSTSSTGSLTYHVDTTASPTDVQIKRAIGAQPGPVAYDLMLPSGGGPLDGSLTLTNASDDSDFQAGHFFLNIVTAANTGGELRGQAIPPGATLFTGVLSGMNEVPPNASTAQGGAQFILSADQTKLSYEAVVIGIVPTGAEIDYAPAGMPSATLYQLTLGQQEVLGQTQVTASDVQKLTSRNVYMNVKDATYLNGELRAPLIPQLPAASQ